MPPHLTIQPPAPSPKSSKSAIRGGSTNQMEGGSGIPDGVNRIDDLIDDGKANSSSRLQVGSVRNRHGVGIPVPAPFLS
jgi:hypothetical protein